ncbi:MAG: AtpZ/AtpI family protein [Balneolaceae bacterium]|nr:AtpZ/AtpI family protein [Balneolaceae bacterium]
MAFSLPILLGYWLDVRYNTSPWLFFCGVLLGIVLMIAIFARMIRNLNKPD